MGKWRRAAGLAAVVLCLGLGGVVLCCDDPPGIGIHSPGDGVIVSGVIPVAAEVTSGGEVKGVDIYVDEKLLDSLPQGSFRRDWDTTAEDNGTHRIYARARSVGRRDGLSKTVTVVVRN